MAQATSGNVAQEAGAPVSRAPLGLEVATRKPRACTQAVTPEFDRALFAPPSDPQTPPRRIQPRAFHRV